MTHIIPEDLINELTHWMNHEPVNNMGKLAQQTRIGSLKEEIKSKAGQTKLEEIISRLIKESNNKK